MLFPVVVKVWAGAERHDFRYISRSLPSLLRGGLPENARVVLIDDRSTDPRVAPFLRELAANDGRVEVWTNPERMGPNRGQEYNFPRVVERFPEAPYFTMCDDDVIYHPGWLQRLIAVHDEAKAAGLTGIFSAIHIPAKPALDTRRLPTSEVMIKERSPALNWLLPREVYEAVGPFRDVGIAFDTDYQNRLAALALRVYCLRPSWVQNIGYAGAYQTDDTWTARDYVGRRDWWLVARDAGYFLHRHTVGRTRRAIEAMPEGPVKRSLLALGRGCRNLVVRRSEGAPT